MGAGMTGIDPEEAGDQGDMLLENSHFNAGVKNIQYIYIYMCVLASVPHVIQEHCVSFTFL